MRFRGSRVGAAMGLAGLFGRAAGSAAASAIAGVEFVPLSLLWLLRWALRPSSGQCSDALWLLCGSLWRLRVRRQQRTDRMDAEGLGIQNLVPL